MDKIILITDIINNNNGRLDGGNGYVIGKFSNTNDLDKCWIDFISTDISLFDITRDFDKREIYVKL